MKKTAALTLLLFLLFQTSFAQKKDIKIIIQEASESFENQDYEITLQKIEEIKIAFKKNIPPPFILSMEILSKCEIIKQNPYENYDLIAETRKLTNSYLKNRNLNHDSDYKSVLFVNNILKTYPKDLATFNALKESKRKEEAVAKEQQEKAAAEVIVRREKEAIEAKAKQERDAIATIERLKQEKIRNEQLAVEREKNRLVEAKEYKQREKESNKKRKKIEREYNRRLNSFSSLGFQSGEIAKYGLLYESGGRKMVGFHISVRTSLISEEDILSGKVLENKTEVELGPNFKIFNRLYLNIGLGYGYYDRVFNNEYANLLYVEKTGYSVATAGLMIRISRVININGGASFMDIEKDFYKPEITFGISFNLKGKNRY
jgi:hypothetical protein